MTTLTSTHSSAGAARTLAAPPRAATNFAIFAAVAVTVGWAGIALDEATNAARGEGLGMGLWLVLPVLTAVLLVRLRRDGGGPLGLTLRFPHRARWFAFAALFYLPFTVLIVLAGIAAGVGRLDVGSAAGEPGLLAGTAAALAPLALKNVFEELAWRGFGTRTAIAAGLPRLHAHLLVGLTWGLWHLPLYAYFMSHSDFRATTSLAWPLFIPIFFAGVLATAVVLGELRLRTGSIWPGVVMHTVGGALVGTLLLDRHLGYSGHADALFSPAPNSLASVVLLALIGFALLRAREAPSLRSRKVAPMPHRLDRWMYRGGRPNHVAAVLNGLWRRAASAGFAPRRMSTLEVRGRRSGRVVSFPVVVADYEHERYLVAMLGERANWVANVRAAGGRAVLRRRGREPVRLEEVDPAERAPILRRYVWRAPGARAHLRVGPRSPLSDFERIAAQYPVFRVGSVNRYSVAADFSAPPSAPL